MQDVKEDCSTCFYHSETLCTEKGSYCTNFKNWRNWEIEVGDIVGCRLFDCVDVSVGKEYTVLEQQSDTRIFIQCDDGLNKWKDKKDFDILRKSKIGDDFITTYCCIYMKHAAENYIANKGSLVCEIRRPFETKSKSVSILKMKFCLWCGKNSYLKKFWK